MFIVPLSLCNPISSGTISDSHRLKNGSLSELGLIVKSMEEKNIKTSRAFFVFKAFPYSVAIVKNFFGGELTTFYSKHLLIVFPEFLVIKSFFQNGRLSLRKRRSKSN